MVQTIIVSGPLSGGQINIGKLRRPGLGDLVDRSSQSFSGCRLRRNAGFRGGKGPRTPECFGSIVCSELLARSGYRLEDACQACRVAPYSACCQKACKAWPVDFGGTGAGQQFRIGGSEADAITVTDIAREHAGWIARECNPARSIREANIAPPISEIRCFIDPLHVRPGKDMAYRQRFLLGRRGDGEVGTDDERRSEGPHPGAFRNERFRAVCNCVASFRVGGVDDQVTADAHMARMGA